jgi:hypothetical protein
MLQLPVLLPQLQTNLPRLEEVLQVVAQSISISEINSDLWNASPRLRQISTCVPSPCAPPAATVTKESWPGWFMHEVHTEMHQQLALLESQ